MASSTTKLFIASCIAVLLACSQNKRETITEVTIVDRVGLFESKIWTTPKTQIEAQLRARADNWAALPEAPQSGKPAPWQLTVSIEEAAEGSARPDSQGRIPKDQVWRHLELLVRLQRLAASSKTVREYEVRFTHSDNRPILEAPKESVRQAVDAALDLLSFDIRLSSAPYEHLKGLLRESTDKERVYVVSELRRRKQSDSVPLLIEWLEKPDLNKDVELEIIGALIAIKDPRAVVPLINSSQRRHEVYLTQIIFGVAEIGGKQAEAYLFTVKAGHSKAMIRKHAADALSELNRRKGKKDE